MIGPEIIIDCDAATIAERGGFGLSVARIDVVDAKAEGSPLARFWITAYVNKQGRPVLEVRTKNKKGAEKDKRVCGVYKKRDQNPPLPRV